MPRFFKEDLPDGISINETFTITGADASHIARVLRMKAGESLTVCNCNGFDFICEIVTPQPDAVLLRVTDKQKNKTEPSVCVTLFQGMPKSDKMDLIVQKSVELGVTNIVPVVTARSVSKPDEKSFSKKIERWNKIAAEAAGQSGRGILPKVLPAMLFKEAVKKLSENETAIMLYEHNGGTLREYFLNKPATVGVMVGPEGGFDESEVLFACENGVATAGMGPRILRTETAPICALSVIMYATGNI